MDVVTTVVTPTAHSTARVMRDMSWMKVDFCAMVITPGLNGRHERKYTVAGSGVEGHAKALL